jgi:hyperosmotically inducible protein
MKAHRLIQTLVTCAVLAMPASVRAQDVKPSTAIRDAWMTTQIHAKFFVDDLVKARRIDVDTTGGVVTLTGEVSSAAERQRAVARAKEVEGVTRVADRLRVAPESAGTSGRAGDKAGAEGPRRGANAIDRLGDTIDDTWVTTKVQSKFYLDPDVKGLQINVSTNGGVVTLTGEAGTEASRKKALSIAKATDGVTQVVDKLEVKSR